MMVSGNGGRTWTGSIYNDLMSFVTGSVAPTADVLVWDACLAPDNSNMIAVAVTDINAAYNAHH